MEVNRCKKCGAFYNTKQDYCANCNIKLEKVSSQIKNYIINEGIDLYEYKNEEDFLGALSYGLGEINKRDLLFGVEQLKLNNELNFDFNLD